LDDTGKHLHQRRFTGAILAEQRRDLSAPDLEIHALERMNPAIGLGNILRGKDNLAVLALDFIFRLHLTSNPTGVTSQFFGLTSLKTPTTDTVCPTRLLASTPSSICFFISLLSAEPAFWYSIWFLNWPNSTVPVASRRSVPLMAGPVWTRIVMPSGKPSILTTL